MSTKPHILHTHNHTVDIHNCLLTFSFCFFCPFQNCAAFAICLLFLHIAHFCIFLISCPLPNPLFSILWTANKESLCIWKLASLLCLWQLKLWFEFIKHFTFPNLTLRTADIPLSTSKIQQLLHYFKYLAHGHNRQCEKALIIQDNL